MTTPTPPLPNKIKNQGGFLPRTQQKKWKRQLKIHHTIRKAIRATCQYPYTCLSNNPDITTLQTTQIPNIPPLPNNPAELHAWIEEIAKIGKNAKTEAHKIITKQTSINCKIAITKYRALLNAKPKTIHKKIFNPTNNNSLDCLQNRLGQILTKPQDIANEIYQTQQLSFQRQAPLYDDVTDHHDTCTCAVRKYPWHTQQGFILEKRGHPNAHISKQFTREIYDSCLKRLTKGKAPGPDNIPNDILKILPPQWQDLLFLFFKQCYKQKTIPCYWKHSKTILLHKKDDPIHLANYRPIALANTIYKLYTSTLTTLLTSYGERHRILHFS